MRIRISTFCIIAVALSGSSIAAEKVPLSALDLTKMQQGFGKPQIDRSIRETSMSIAGKTFEHGVGTHANSALWVDLAGGADSFHAVAGVDDAANGPGSIEFKIFGDGSLLWKSGLMHPHAPGKPVDIPLTNTRTLLLKVYGGDDGTAFDHANWADAHFMVSGTKPRAIDLPQEKPYMLTPPPPASPRINCPAVYGCRPGNPFLYRIPATGKRPLIFVAEGLPSGLKLDGATGIITGTAPAKGEHTVILHAANNDGESTKSLKIVSGDKLALTPYMGWNHWYTHVFKITDAIVRRAADAMISSGMADVGYSYVGIDDCWMNAANHHDPKRVGPLRDANGNILPNSEFPDMKALTRYIHDKGLKAGIYSSPGTLTCSGFGASYGNEAKDATQFAEWGFDLLKYDWCSYDKIAPNPTLDQMQKPYILMGRLIREQKRDIIFNLCQYGWNNVWEWGSEVDGHSWRTGGDLGFELDRIFEVAARNAQHRAWNGPGAWNDPDYLQIGHYLDARTLEGPRPCPLSATEQYSFMSLWCLSAAPLVFSGDMDRLDPFTLNILCNPEVIEVNQDPLGQCGTVSPLSEECFLMVKEMSDGSKAVGLCNGSEMDTTLTASWPAMGISGKHIVRDVWRHKDIGEYDGKFTSKVPRRGVVMVRIRQAGS